METAAGVTLSLGRIAPAGRVEGGIDPSMVLFDNPVDRLRTRNDFERSLEGSRRGCGSMVRGDGVERPCHSRRTVHAVAGRGEEGLSPLEHGLAATS